MTPSCGIGRALYATPGTLLVLAAADSTVLVSRELHGSRGVRFAPQPRTPLIPLSYCFYGGCAVTHH